MFESIITVTITSRNKEAAQAMINLPGGEEGNATIVHLQGHVSTIEEFPIIAGIRIY